ncbi:hypothetical protein [Streptomyces durhamensis]|uniref:hypothetical protein n=1 Tax=Streptomyces durhamensis TaxID=68194 RepID=UPI0004CC9825|nr:hypothetical protein [Streptomyces durhamensis]
MGELRERWFKRNADAMSRWSERLIFLGACAIGIHRAYQHAFIHASLWFAAGLGGTLTHITDARRARRNAERARQHQLHTLAELFREAASSTKKGP